MDANDRVYFVDTYIEDIWLHRWEDGGDNYLYAVRGQSMAADDRPWVSAQGDGVVHYLGNSGVGLPCVNGVGRYWYYRSTDGGNTFTEQCYALPGGWAHIAGERNGDYTYIAQEVNNGGAGGIQVYVNDNQGALDSWSDPVWVGPSNGTHPEGYPWVSVGQNGTVFITWQESPNAGREPTTLYIARSDDYGATWNYWDVPAGHPNEECAVFLYPNLYVGRANLFACTYYGNTGPQNAGHRLLRSSAAVADPGGASATPVARPSSAAITRDATSSTSSRRSRYAGEICSSSSENAGMPWRRTGGK